MKGDWRSHYRRLIKQKPDLTLDEIVVAMRKRQIAGSREILTEAAKEFLKSTGRIVSVKYFVSTLHRQDGALTHVHSFQEISNPRNRFDAARNWDLICRIRRNSTI
jgi:hypothetical protein